MLFLTESEISFVDSIEDTIVKTATVNVFKIFEGRKINMKKIYIAFLVLVFICGSVLLVGCNEEDKFWEKHKHIGNWVC